MPRDPVTRNNANSATTGSTLANLRLHTRANGNAQPGRRLASTRTPSSAIPPRSRTRFAIPDAGRLYSTSFIIFAGFLRSVRRSLSLFPGAREQQLIFAAPGAPAVFALRG